MACSFASSLSVLAPLLLLSLGSALVLPQLGLCVATMAHSLGQENFAPSLLTPTLTYEYEVRKEGGSLAEAILNGPEDKVNIWKAALTNVANLAGLHLKPYRDMESSHFWHVNSWSTLKVYLAQMFVVVGFQIGSGVNAIFGCVDGGRWVVVLVLVGLIWVWVVVVLLMEGIVVVADVLRIPIVMVVVVPIVAVGDGFGFGFGGG
nr:hypothetical protein CFP56_49878 [Quercus suber]